MANSWILRKMINYGKDGNLSLAYHGITLRCVVRALYDTVLGGVMNIKEHGAYLHRT